MFHKHNPVPIGTATVFKELLLHVHRQRMSFTQAISVVKSYSHQRRIASKPHQNHQVRSQNFQVGMASGTVLSSNPGILQVYKENL